MRRRRSREATSSSTSSGAANSISGWSPVFVRAEKIGKEGPARAITGKMVETEIDGDGFKPTGRAWLGAELLKTLEGLEEDFLRDVLGLGGVGHQAHGGAKRPCFGRFA